MRLKIVGSGDQKKILLDLISSLDLNDIVSLKDRVFVVGLLRGDGFDIF